MMGLGMMGLGRTVSALILSGALLCSAPSRADPRADEAPWLPVSQVMSELARNPEFVEALYRRLGRNPKAGGILGPDEIKRLREMILGKDFEGLDRFPGLTVQGMGRSVRLAGATLGRSSDDDLPPEPATVEQAAKEKVETAVEEGLGIPAAGTPPAPDAYLRPLGFGLEAGDRVDPALAERYADGLRLAELLNRLSLNAPDGGERYRVVLDGQTDGQTSDTPRALVEALAQSGHDVEVRDSRYFANFGDLIYHGRDVLTPFWIDTRLPVPGTDRNLLVPVSHSQHELIVRGPVVNADLSFYFGIDGQAVFRPSVTRDQAWVMGRVAHRYRGEEAMEVIRLAGVIVRAYDAIKRRHPELPFGGYYALGVCNDVNAMIELRMRGETTLFPLTLDPQFFTDTGEVGRLAESLPLDSGWRAAADPRRILGSLPVDDLAALPLPSLREDLEKVRAAWEGGRLPRPGVRDIALVGAVMAGLLAAGLWSVRLWLVRRRR
ncbi:hypothetical protein FW320_27045 [Azospirillum sp. Vi22]|uniref:hypothetical protein n=1 Tax=Azospirillum baldaniorum TaxID=1064539 RepID=UPI00157A429C|nr:hypothetical protein [Azospirillum baldaniorum]NUB09804.1 hypothetical protein [Azospirillum baldaniorum]